MIIHLSSFEMIIHKDIDALCPYTVSCTCGWKFHEPKRWQLNCISIYNSHLYLQHGIENPNVPDKWYDLMSHYGKSKYVL